MATSRRRTAKKNIGQNLNELEGRIKKVERRPRSNIGSYSITSDLIAPGSVTLDKLDPALLQMLLDAANNNDSTGDSVEYVVSGGTDGSGLVTGIVDSVISQYNFSTTSASGKNSIYWQSTEPTGGEYADGDIWYDTSLSEVDNLPQYTPHRYNASIPGWEPAEFGDGAFRFIDAGKISTGILDAGIAIRVGTYPLDAAPVGKSRVEIASSFPVASGGTFSGIRVLKKTAEGQTEEGTDNDPSTAGFYQSLEINADTGRFRVGGSDEYLLYDAAANKLSLSGRLVTGTDVNGNPTNESLLIGTDISDEKDGIRMGPYNYWYRPNSVPNSSDLIFKVGSSGTEGLTVTKGGAVNFEGTANPTGGVIKGKLSIRDIAGAVDRIEIGQNVLSNRDGLRIDANNHWTVSNTGGSTAFSVGSNTKQLTYDTVSGLLKLTGGDIALTGGGSFKTSDGDTRVEMNSNGIFGYTGGTKTFWVDAATGDSSFEGVTNPTGGTVKGKLTIQGTTYAFGKNVMSTPARDGLFLNNNNYWVLSQTGSTATFKVGGDSKYLEWTGGQLNIRTDTLLIGDQTAATQAYADSAAGSAFSSVNVLQKLNDSITGVSITSLGYIFSVGKTTYQSNTNGWFIGFNETVANGGTEPNATGRKPVMYIGDSNQYVKWTGTALEIQAKNPSAGLAGFSLTGGTNPNILFGDSDTSVQMDRDGFFFNGYPGLSGPGSVRGRFTIRQSYADSSVNFSMFGVNVTNYTTTPIARIKIRDTAPTSSTSAGSIEILGNVSITGNLSVTGTGGGSSGGYSNATDGTTTNKITYGGTAPTSGRTAGDIHIEF